MFILKGILTLMVLRDFSKLKSDREVYICWYRLYGGTTPWRKRLHTAHFNPLDQSAVTRIARPGFQLGLTAFVRFDDGDISALHTHALLGFSAGARIFGAGWA